MLYFEIATYNKHPKQKQKYITIYGITKQNLEHENLIN